MRNTAIKKCKRMPDDFFRCDFSLRMMHLFIRFFSCPCTTIFHAQMSGAKSIEQKKGEKKAAGYYSAANIVLRL
jgi:hypothetical protein